MEFGRIWNGQAAQEVRRKFYQGSLPDFCFHCPFIINQELSYLEVDNKKALFVAEDYEENGRG